MMEALRVTLKREEISVILELEDGSERELVLREMVGKDRDAHLQSMASKMKLSPKGDVIGVKSFDGLQAGLLARCLYDASTDELVPLKEIHAYPTKTQIALFKVAQEINGLNQEAEEEAKND